MTVILAAKDKNGKPYIGGDSCGFTNYFKYEYGTKISKIKNFLIGGSGSYRTQQLIEYNKDRFKNINNEKDVFDFLQVLKDILRKDWTEREMKTDEDIDNNINFLIITKKDIYELDSDYSFHKVKIAATGIGSEYCLGAFTAIDKKKDIVKRIKEAIEITKKWHPFVGGKVYIETLKK